MTAVQAAAGSARVPATGRESVSKPHASQNLLTTVAAHCGHGAPRCPADGVACAVMLKPQTSQ
jgi:hypothetical protein